MESVEENEEPTRIFLRKDLQELLVIALGHTAAYLSLVMLHTRKIIKNQALDSLNFLKMRPFSKFGKRLFVSIEGKGALILLKSRKRRVFVNFISRQKRSKLP